MRIFLLLILSSLLFVSCRVQQNSSDTQEMKDRKFYKVYSKKLGVELTGKESRRLVKSMAEWLGVPYKFGGCEKTGTDCSCFVKAIYKDVYFKEIPRNTVELFDKSEKINQSELKEGDLVFFAINATKPTHVGLYIGNNKFIHATTSKGVMISDLTEAYYVKHFTGAGRYRTHG